MSECTTHQLVGEVTKMFPTFGYINDNIFFQRKCVLGPMVQVGDNVAASAVYQPSMPIKWSAEKVWRVQDSTRVHPKGDSDEKKWSDKTRSKSPVQAREPRDSRPKVASSPRESIASNRRHRDDSESRPRSRDISITSDYKRRRLSPTLSTHSRSPLRRSNRLKSDWDAKALLNVKELIVPDIQFRFPRLLPPVDLYRLICHWQDSFPLLKPMQPDRSTCFQVVKSNSVETPIKLRSDTGFFVNVLLLSMPSINTLQDKTITRAEGPDLEKPPLRKYIKLLAVSRPREQFKAIGGPWNPELDGPDPLANPDVLIKTAIRVCKEQVALDLTYCTQWHRFLEFRYSRTEGSTARPISVLFPSSQLWGRQFSESSHKSSAPMKPFHRIVVYFLPDIWSIMPSSDAWSDVKTAMETALSGGSLQNFPMSPIELKTHLKKEKSSESASSADLAQEDSVTKTREMGDQTSDTANATPTTQISPDGTNSDLTGKDGNATTEVAETTQQEESVLKSPSTTSGGAEEDGGNSKLSKKSHDELNLSAMKVSELREQLKVRNLPADGIKAQLLSRLKTAVEKEAELAKKVEEERKRKEKELQEAQALKEEQDKQRESLKPAEQPPVTPAEVINVSLRNYASIIVQNRLHNDYIIQAVSLDAIFDSKEETMDSRAYEFIICAHNLLDMIRRDCIFTLFRALVSAGDRGVQAKARPKLALDRHDRSAVRSRDPAKESDKDVIPFTVDVPLLCACTFLDYAHREYFTAEDVEDMIFTLGLSVSRYQVRSLITKVADNHKIYYRSLTDAEVTPSTVRSTSLYSEIDDDEYLLELIRGGDAILDEQKDSHLPLGSVLILQGSALEDSEPNPDDSTSTVLTKNIRQLELERAKLKKQLQSKTEEIDRLRVFVEQIPQLKERLQSATSSANDYRRRLRAECDRIHYVHRILEQQIEDLDCSRNALRQAAHRLRAHDGESASSKKSAPEPPKTQDPAGQALKSEEVPVLVERGTAETTQVSSESMSHQPDKSEVESKEPDEAKTTEVGPESKTLTDSSMDISVSVVSSENKMLNGLGGDGEASEECQDVPMADDLASSTTISAETAV